MFAFKSDTMSKLCSQDQLELLDSIDRLRLQGINNYVSLPQIIVCGDQSSGKSSVLEAISGVSFPISSNLCTRFPTELVLRRAPHVSASVSIVPHQSRSESEQIALENFQEHLDGFAELPKLVESAKLAMGINVHGKAFSKDILRVEITGPDRPHLTIVDLPGLIHSATKHQSVYDVELIRDVVQGYMKQSRCIILAVVSAKNDFANQVVLKLARAADSSGTRTLGVITKPDDLVPGSDRESLYVSLARNQEVEFRLGWHVLKNMDSEKGSSTLDQRDAEETQFFDEGAWASLPRTHLGIDKLRDRLSKLLLGQIASELPSLMTEIGQKFKACQTQLEKLSLPRSSLDDQRRYLFQLSQSFQALVKSSTSGNYNDKFFENAMTQKGYAQRFRAVVQNLNRAFTADLTQSGHFREVEPDDSGTKSSHDNFVTRKDFLDHIEKLMVHTRGRELPGMFNPMIVADLFREQCQPWEAIAYSHVETVWKAAARFIDLVVSHIADGSTTISLKRHIIQQSMTNIRLEMRAKTSELLSPHKFGHPITYNHYFTETIQQVRRQRLLKESEKVLCTFFEAGKLTDSMTLADSYGRVRTWNLKHLAESLAGMNEPDMDRYAAMEALDCLHAYYKVALKRFIDDVSVEVIEAKLVSVLDDILSPVSVFEMNSDLVGRIAGESEESRTIREELTKQREVLRNGLETCKRFSGFRTSGDSVSVSNTGSGAEEYAFWPDNDADSISDVGTYLFGKQSIASDQAQSSSEGDLSLSTRASQEELDDEHWTWGLSTKKNKKEKKKGTSYD